MKLGKNSRVGRRARLRAIGMCTQPPHGVGAAIRYAVFAVISLTSVAAQEVSSLGAGAIQLNSPLRPVFETAPGSRHEGEIILRNTGTAPVTVRVSHVDYLPGPDGSRYPEAGTLPRSNAAWLSIGPSVVEVAAGQRVAIPYRIEVPADPRLAGSYWSMFLLEPDDASATATTARGRV